MLVLSFMLWALIVIVYIFPLALAQHRRCEAFAGIAIINIFLGWTLIGWVVALAWAASGKVRPPAPVATAQPIPTAAPRRLTEDELRLAYLIMAGANVNQPNQPPQ